MKKYYDIWSNDLGIYQALLSYENKKEVINIIDEIVQESRNFNSFDN